MGSFHYGPVRESLRSPLSGGPTLFIILLVAAVTLSTCRNRTDSTVKLPRASQGVLDLSSWDFHSAGPAELRGEWEFYFGEFVAPSAFTERPAAKKFITIPGAWKGVDTDAGPAGPYGIATYRLRILLPEKAQRLGIRIGEVSGACRVFANGREVSGAGRIGLTKEEVEPDYRPLYFETGAGSELYLVVHEASFEDAFGGRFWQAGAVGTVEDVAVLRVRNVFSDSFIAGLVFVVAALFFVLFSYRRFDQASLLFSLMCFGIFLYQIDSSEHVVSYLSPRIPYRIFFHVRWIVLGSLPGLYALIFSKVYPADIHRLGVRFIVAVSSAFTLSAFFFPMDFFIRILPVFHLYASTVLIYILFILIRARFRGREDAGIFILGLLVFIIATVNDTLLVDLNINSINLLPIGQIGFIFSWAVALSRRFARDYRRAETLSEWNRRLRELDEAKTSFFANSSHELRTPVTLLAAPIEGILSGRYGETIRRDHPVFGIMKRNADRLKRLADGLLELLQVDAGSVTPAIAAVDLGSFLARYTEEFREMAEKRGIELEYRGEASVTAAVDPSLLETCVLNLLSNSLKFTPAGGRVTASAEAGEGKAFLLIEDTGIGMEKERLPKLFERFAASGEKTRSDYSGFGIGLPLTGELVRLMGGSVEVESEPGKGTRFKLGFPPHEGKPVEFREPSRERLESFLPRPPDSLETAEGGGESERVPILIVDDDRDMAAFLHSSLDGDFSARTVSSGAEALFLLEKGFRPRIVVCDVMMPGINGFELKRSVDGMERLAGTPFLFLTAKADQASRFEGLSAGAVDYITKPFDIEELELKLRSLASLVKADHERLERSILKVLRGEDGPAQDGKHWRLRAAELGIGEKDFELVALLLEGLGDKEIAARIGCSHRTISNRISAILKSTGASNRASLIVALVKP